MVCYTKFIILKLSYIARLVRTPSLGLLLKLITILLFTLSVFTHAKEPSKSPILTERLAVETAIKDNPNLAQISERYNALTQVPPQEGSLPDPVISLNAMNFPVDSFSRSQEAMTQVQIGFSQEIPFPGKLSLKEEAANYDAVAASHSVSEARLRLINNVKRKWWELYYLDRALETLKVNKTLLRQFISVARTKYETGKGLQQDVLLAQLELSKLLEKNIKLQALRRNQAIRLNVLMDTPANQVVSLPNQIQKSMPKLADELVLYQKAEASRPWLKEISAQVDAARTRLDLAKRNFYPDFKLGMVYGNRTGSNPLPRGGDRSDFVSIMVGVKIPFYASRKQSKAVLQKGSELQKTQYTLQDEKAAVMEEISSAVTDYSRAKQEFSLYGDGIVPQAEQTVASMLAGYQVSEVDFLNLVRSQVTLINYQLQYWKALSNAKQALARLEAAVGVESIYE